MTAEHVNLITNKTDSEKAKVYKEKLASLLQPICDLMTEAKKTDNIILGFQLQMDGMQRTFISNVAATKEL